MKRIKIIFPVAIIAIVVIVVIVRAVTPKREVPPRTALAIKATVVQTVEATGAVSAVQDLALGFKTTGIVDTVSVQVGDVVKAGALLASLSDPSLQAAVDRARAAVSSAEADFEELRSGATTDEVKIKEREVEQVRAELSTAATTSENSTNKKTATGNGYVETALKALASASLVTDYSLDIIFDSILDPGAQSSIRLSNRTLLGVADQWYGTARGALINAEIARSEASASVSESNTVTALVSMRDALESSYDTVSRGLDVVSSMIPTSEYPQATIDDYRSLFNARATAVAAERTSIQTSLDNMTTGMALVATELDAALSREREVEARLQLVEAQLSEMIAAPQSYELKKFQARLLEAQADLRVADSNARNAILVAPVDGTVTAVEIERGEVIAANQQAISMISEQQLRIEVDIPETDITKVALGMPVMITLDALGPQQRLSGSVTFIEPAEQVIQDVVYYRVIVSFVEPPAEIKHGMTADVAIRSAERSDVIAIPARAIAVRADGSQVVRVYSERAIAERVVETGVRGDDGLIEVTDGIAENEAVVIGDAEKK